MSKSLTRIYTKPKFEIVLGLVYGLNEEKVVTIACDQLYKIKYTASSNSTEEKEIIGKVTQIREIENDGKNPLYGGKVYNLLIDSSDDFAYKQVVVCTTRIIDVEAYEFIGDCNDPTHDSIINSIDILEEDGIVTLIVTNGNGKKIVTINKGLTEDEINNIINEALGDHNGAVDEEVIKGYIYDYMEENPVTGSTVNIEEKEDMIVLTVTNADGEKTVNIKTIGEATVSEEQIQQLINATLKDYKFTVSENDIEQAVYNYMLENPVSGGVDGKDGKDGVTPSFSIGNVETLAAGSQATASIGGTAENPVLNIGVPKGATGEKGEKGDPGKDGAKGEKGDPGKDGIDSNILQLSGKNIVFLGDSIAWGKTEDPNKMNPIYGTGEFVTGFEYCIKKKYPDSNVYCFATDGGILAGGLLDTFSNITTCIGTIESGLDKMEESNIVPDYIIMDGGANDISYMATLGLDILGNPSDIYNRYHEKTTGMTIVEGLEDIFIRIRKSYPACKIIYFSIPQPTIESLRLSYGDSMTDEMIAGLIQVQKVMVNCYNVLYRTCKNYKVQFIDLFNEGLDLTDRNNAIYYTIDGLHPNLKGYQYMYPIMDDALINMRYDDYTTENNITDEQVAAVVESYMENNSINTSSVTISYDKNSKSIIINTK